MGEWVTAWKSFFGQMGMAVSVSICLCNLTVLWEMSNLLCLFNSSSLCSDKGQTPTQERNIIGPKYTAALYAKHEERQGDMAWLNTLPPPPLPQKCSNWMSEEMSSPFTGVVKYQNLSWYLQWMPVQSLPSTMSLPQSREQMPLHSAWALGAPTDRKQHNKERKEEREKKT